MSETETTQQRAQVVPLPDDLRSVQPGGGFCYSVELAWGRLRRWYLTRFRSAYVRRMAECRRGDVAGAPHEVLDPRDLKFCRNQCTASWDAADDPFRWRERIPFARWGLAELQLIGWPLAAATVALGMTGWPYWPAALVPGILLLLVVYFFRDPTRRIPQQPGLLVSPADGKIAEISQLQSDPFIGGPAVRIGIFLSIFNVHINRSPCEARVVELRYSPGLFLNALKPESALKNENMWIGMEQTQSPHRLLVVRQIAGAIARRIVCGLRPGEELATGEKFGMIKLGSRTELIVPLENGLKVDVSVGQTVKAGSTVLARYEV